MISGCLGLGGRGGWFWEVTAMGFFLGDKNILKLDCGYGSITV